MQSSFARSRQVVTTSISTLRADKHLFIPPLLSGLFGSMVYMSLWLVWPDALAQPLHRLSPAPMLALVVMSIAISVVAWYCMATLHACVLNRFSGEPRDLGTGFSRAASVLPTICILALAFCLAGLLIQIFAEAFGPVGQIIITIVLTTALYLPFYLALPILVRERTSAMQTLRRSVALFRRAWREVLLCTLFFMLMVLGINLGALAVFLLAMLGLGAVGQLPLSLILLPVFLLFIVVAGLIMMTLGTMFPAVLYNVTTDGESPEPSAPALYPPLSGMH